MKGKSSCPMCRASMCFKGITKLKKEWYQEKRQETYVNLVMQMFDELMEEYDDIILQCLEVVQNRYEYALSKYPDISCDMLDMIMRITWVDIDYLMNGLMIKVYPEPRTYEKYLMISKYEKKPSHKIRYYVSTSGNNDSNIMLPVFIHRWWCYLV
jgi:hypothetical protein